MIQKINKKYFKEGGQREGTLLLSKRQHKHKLTREVWRWASRPNCTREAVCHGAWWSREPASASTHGETSARASARGTSLTLPRHLA